MDKPCLLKNLIEEKMEGGERRGGGVKWQKNLKIFFFFFIFKGIKPPPDPLK